MKKVKLIAVLLLLTLGLAACTSAPNSSAEHTPPEELLSGVIDSDREGNPITLPSSIQSIMTLGPSNTEILVALGFADLIIAACDNSANVPGLPADIPLLSMLVPDGERIIDLNPDIIFATSMSRAGGDDPFKLVRDVGICVVYIPSSSSIAEIKDDIRFLAAVMGVESRGDELVTEMEQEIERIAALGSAVAEKKRVYFEIAAAPFMYSFGTGVFLHEMIELIGAVNIFAEHESWIFVPDESVLEADPDVILTVVNYIEDPVAEIKARPGWESMTAVQENAVFYIDTDASNRPSHNIVRALREMIAAVYPELR